MNKFGEIKIQIKGILEKDYQGNWERTGWYRFLRDVYSKYIIPARTDRREIDTINRTQEFKDEMKAYFELQGIREREDF